MKKRILISNGRFPKVLDLIRRLASKGHLIYVTETRALYLSRFSKALFKSFVVPSPRFSPLEHIDALINIIKEHKIDLFIPTWEDAFVVSSHLEKFPASCTVLVEKFALLLKLHEKGSFIRLLDELQVAVPKTVAVESLEELKAIDLPLYALKGTYSRGSKKIYKVRKGEPLPAIRFSSPWIAQEWVEGKNFATFTICHQGKIYAHSTYPMEFVVQKPGFFRPKVGGFSLSFRSIDHPAIYEWTKSLVAKLNYTGLIAFDLIENQDGVIYPIECNPRGTSGMTLFPEDADLAGALLGTLSLPCIAPAGIKKQMLFAQLRYGWKVALACKKPLYFLQQLLTYGDLTFSLKDLRPFFTQFFLIYYHFSEKIRGRNSHGDRVRDIEYNGKE